MDTTVTISIATAKKIDRICKANQCTKKDFLSAAVTYFEWYGINPLSHESPAQEMERLIKRVDQVIAFIRTQEKEILRPACEAIFSTDERIKLNLENLASKQDIKNISERFQLVTSNLKDNQSLINQTKSSQEQGFKLLSKLIDAKEKTGVFGDLSKIYNQQ
ncbi:BfmA/BtgA family mobilization protein [Dysgonomonas sp. ZJ279]|uniref:BfmA/BtgA family mobilization protein n=1 Tax=Dysgonomonas sp. ZJ279 TaxID=2709796 RepID=UPI0013EBDA6D|nr:BfmA/BtgA family mobilization protein [Dysgonomonas sp. ZJ279]